MDKLELANTRLADQTPAQRAALTTRMNRAGLASGIEFNWGGKLGPNPASRDAHRLVRLVGDKYGDQTQRELVEAIFDAYHCRAQDVADHNALLDAARRAGVDAGDAQAWLQSDEAGDVIDQEADKSKAAAAARSGGVPTLVIQGTYRPEGVPDVADLMEIFVQIKEAE